MSPVDKNLLMRIARRLEEQAEEDYKRVPVGADAKVHENARRKRDRELGDAKDLREFVKRQDAASPAGALVEASPLAQHADSTPGGAAPGRVVHCKRDAFDVYIGRPSQFGNPYRVMSEKDREPAIAAFEKWARLMIETTPDYAEAVKGLHGKTLGCWCAPKRCHGEVLLKLAAELSVVPSHDGHRT